MNSEEVERLWGFTQLCMGLCFHLLCPVLKPHPSGVITTGLFCEPPVPGLDNTVKLSNQLYDILYDFCSIFSIFSGLRSLIPCVQKSPHNTLYCAVLELQGLLRFLYP